MTTNQFDNETQQTETQQTETQQTETQQTEIQRILEKVGKFSSYQTTRGPGQDITYFDKPATIFLTAIGVNTQGSIEEPLSTWLADGCKSFEDINIACLADSGSQEPAKMNITKERLQALWDSAKIYVNTSVVPSKEYSKYLNKKTHRPQSYNKCETNQEYWQNLATNIVHVQKIDLLVEQKINDDKKSIACPREGTITVNDPAVLLLSSPALNFNYGSAKYISEEKRPFYIENMYRNLFDAALKEGYKFIAMPAAGLGIFRGDPTIYFKALFKVAQEKRYADLTIIYNPAMSKQDFEDQKKDTSANNVIQTDKDVLFVAHELTKNGFPCAYHNPSDSDVSFGVYDVGEYWKTGKDERYLGEEHVGSMTTAVMNSMGLNPKAYEKIIERKLDLNQLLLEKFEQDNNLCIIYDRGSKKIQITNELEELSSFEDDLISIIDKSLHLNEFGTEVDSNQFKIKLKRLIQETPQDNKLVEDSAKNDQSLVTNNNISPDLLTKLFEGVTKNLSVRCISLAAAASLMTSSILVAFGFIALPAILPAIVKIGILITGALSGVYLIYEISKNSNILVPSTVNNFFTQKNNQKNNSQGPHHNRG